MRLIDHEYDFNFGVDVKQSLHEETVGDLVLFSLIVFEAGTVVEGEVVDDQFVGH
jgi:hypothetical protein